MQGWIGEAELRRKPKSKLPFSVLLSTLQPLLCSIAGFFLCVTPHAVGFTLLESVNKIFDSKGRPVLCSFLALFVCRALETTLLFLTINQPYFLSVPGACEWATRAWTSGKAILLFSLLYVCAFYTFPTYSGSRKGKSLSPWSWSVLWSNFSLPAMSTFRDLLWSFFTLIKILSCYY